MFDFTSEYVFGRRLGSSRRFVDEFGREQVEPIFISVGVERGKVVKYDGQCVVLDSGTVLPLTAFDFAVKVQDEKQVKLEK